MCIIVLKRKAQIFEPELVERMAEMGNDDGAGSMHVEGERDEKGRLVRPGRVIVRRTMAKPAELKDWYKEVMDNNIAVHVRNATLGDINEENCHPYCVLSKDLGHKVDLYMMHNGTIRDVQVDKSMSDSWNFAEKFLRPLLAKRPSMMMDPVFIHFLCGIIGPNKLVFLDNYERFTIINEDMGATHSSGAWISTKMDVVVRPKVVPSGPHLPMVNPQTPASSYPRGFGPKMHNDNAYNHAEGGTWELDVDGMSHFHPKVTSANAEATSDEPVEEATVSGSSKPRRPPVIEDLDIEGLEKMRTALPKMDQQALHGFVCESPVEAAQILVEMSQDTPMDHYNNYHDNYMMALDKPWEMVNALLLVSRGTQEVHEVN